MSLVTALAISIGVLGGIATFVVLGPLAALNLQIWAIFIAWACFYHSGGKEAGLRNTIVNNVFGVVVGWITLLLISQIPLGATLGLPVWAGIVVFVMVFALVIAAHNPMFAVIPAGVYGFAAVVAQALLGTKLDTLLAASMHNPLIVIVVSMIVGAVLGWVSEKIAVALAARPVPQRA
ncbi:MAG: DUF1097 domain-containing protein [Acetobacteraceae bacterium]